MIETLLSIGLIAIILYIALPIVFIGFVAYMIFKNFRNF